MTHPDESSSYALRIFLYAEEYRISTTALKAQFRRNPSGTQLHVSLAAHIAPTIHLDSFALELYFKCLQVIERGTAARGHRPKKLFAALKSETQQSIRSQYEGLLTADPIARHFEANLQEPAPDFEKCLDLSDRIFDNIRYLYEGHKGRMFYWPLLREAARRTILSAKPEWIPTDSTPVAGAV